jgi:YHS domain-containing protein
VYLRRVRGCGADPHKPKGFSMKKFLAFVLIALIGGFSLSAQANTTLKKVEPQYVCMINNKLFDKAQIPVTVNGKTYYGCCPMCKEKLEKSAEARNAVDPVSKKSVDKATATIGAAPDGTVYYFENEANLKKYGSVK